MHTSIYPGEILVDRPIVVPSFHGEGSVITPLPLLTLLPLSVPFSASIILYYIRRFKVKLFGMWKYAEGMGWEGEV